MPGMECSVFFFPDFNFREKACDDGHKSGQVDSVGAEQCHCTPDLCIKKGI